VRTVFWSKPRFELFHFRGAEISDRAPLRECPVSGPGISCSSPNIRYANPGVPSPRGCPMRAHPLSLFSKGQNPAGPLFFTAFRSSALHHCLFFLSRQLPISGKPTHTVINIPLTHIGGRIFNQSPDQVNHFLYMPGGKRFERRRRDPKRPQVFLIQQIVFFGNATSLFDKVRTSGFTGLLDDFVIDIGDISNKMNLIPRNSR